MDQLQAFLGYSPMQLLIPAILFVVLSPGMITTLPPGPSGKRWLSEETSRCAVLVHALVFVIAYYFARKYLGNLF